MRACIASGNLRPVNVPVAVRSLQGMLMGLTILPILGDDGIATHRDDVPEVLVALLFNDPGPKEAA